MLLLRQYNPSHTKVNYLKYRIILIFVAAVWLNACTPKPPVYHEQLVGFGTLIEVKIWNVDKKKGAEAVALLAKDFDYMHRTWHPWEPGPLGRINQLLPMGDKFSVAPSVLPLIRKATLLSEKSEGRFNPAIGKLIKLWGFDGKQTPEAPPSPDQIEALLEKNPRMQDIKLEGIEISSTNSAVVLDFGGFAKGYGVDMAIEQLKILGLNNAIVNAGGDLRAIGSHGERPWRIGIRNPRGGGMLASVDVMGDESVFTSGDYERYFMHDGIRYFHIIDPHTGYPARGAVSVTVFHHSAAEADAAATALLVAGPEEWYEVARAMGVKGVILVDHRGKVYMTPGLRAEYTLM